MSLTATVPSGSAVLSLTYDFAFGYANNGNVRAIVNNRDTTRSQNFAYDALNRLLTGQSTGSTWGNSYVYDIWGRVAHSSPPLA